MTHPEPDLLDALAYGMLEADSAREVERHLSGCAACRAALSKRRGEAAVVVGALGRPRRRLWPGLAAAAAVLLAVITVSVRDRPGALTLADGSTVWAEGDVEIVGDRAVRCGRGEFRFEIMAGDTPFLVTTPAATVRVMGTTFGVSVRERDMRGTRAVVTGVAVATGSVAVANFFGLIELTAGERATVSEYRAPRREVADDPRARDLVERIEAAKRREAELRARLGRQAGPAPEAPTPPEPVAIPEAVRAAARDLGASEVAVRAALRADAALGSAGDREAALAALAVHGADGFRATVALLRAGRNGTWFRELLRPTFSPGLEALLIEVAEDEGVHIWSRWSALASLGVADTVKTRDYLVGRIRREDNPGLFLQAAEALALLREPRGANAVDERIVNPRWSGVRGGILRTLGEMGGPEATRILVEWLRRPHADALSSAVSALARIDPAAAAGEARTLLASSRARSFDVRFLAQLTKIAGE